MLRSFASACPAPGSVDRKTGVKLSIIDYLIFFLSLHIYDPGSRFADPPPTLPKPNLCDCAHFFHMRAPKATTVTRIASQDA